MKLLINTVKQYLHSLNNLKESYTNTNAMFISLILSKLPPNIIKQWNLTLPNKEVPQYTQLLDLLERLALSSITASMVIATRGQALSTCPTCRGPHTIWRCDSFKAKPFVERLKNVEWTSLCINCLRKGHSVRNCHAGSCRTCGERHHTMLHKTKHH